MRTNENGIFFSYFVLWKQKRNFQIQSWWFPMGHFGHYQKTKRRNKSITSKSGSKQQATSIIIFPIMFTLRLCFFICWCNLALSLEEGRNCSMIVNSTHVLKAVLMGFFDARLLVAVFHPIPSAWEIRLLGNFNYTLIINPSFMCWVEMFMIF